MFTINDLEATAAFAKIIGEAAEPGDNLVLTGDLGAGKQH